MNCLLHVLKTIGIFAAGMVFILAIVWGLGAAAIGIANLFGWREVGGFITFCALMISAIGTFVGVMECRET